MKKVVVFIAMIGMMLGMCACSSEKAGDNETKESKVTKVEESESIVAEESGAESTESHSEEAEEVEQETLQQEEAEVYSWEEISVTIPEAWRDKYFVQETSRGLVFYQKASYEKETGYGQLCSIVRNENMFDYPSAEVIGYTDQYIYYILFPTDVTALPEDAGIKQEYSTMKGYRNLSKAVTINSESARYDAKEFCLPLSGVKEIPSEYLYCLDKQEVRIARSEIYARYGVIFEEEDLNEHFTACSWYTPTVEAAAFDEGVLSQIELDNIAILTEREGKLK
ncbi:MAG: YARHG domain-containing protein [Lachnospiraceae bacterium]|nr:YARHG domain-containing protein [Lachnospiraceae bacterium]